MHAEFNRERRIAIRRRKSLVDEKKRRKAMDYDEGKNHKETDFERSRFWLHRKRKSPNFKALTERLDYGEFCDDVMEEDDLSFVYFEDALISFCNRSKNSFVTYVPWRVRRDIKPNASKKYKGYMKNGKTKSEYRYNSVLGRGRWEFTSKQRRKRPFKPQSRKKQINSEAVLSKKTALKKAEDFSLEERTILNLKDLHTAAGYISRREAKADYFRHPDSRIDEAVQIILSYAQSRTERNLPYDMKDIIKGKNSMVNGRLKEWEEKHDKRIITIQNIFAGRFYKPEDQRNGFRYSFIPLDTRVLVSANYRKSPERYVASQQEFLSAIKRIFRKEITDIEYFNILDPVTTVALEWCLDVSKNGYDYRFKPRDIAEFRNPELLQALGASGLTDSNGEPIRYKFFFNKDDYNAVRQAEIREQKDLIAAEKKAEREEYLEKVKEMQSRWKNRYAGEDYLYF